MESFNNLQFLETRKLSGWEASAFSSEYVTSTNLDLWYLHVKIDVLTDQDSQRGVRLSSKMDEMSCLTIHKNRFWLPCEV